MSGLLPLTIEDFELQQTSSGSNVLCNKIKNGFSLILFYSSDCPHCQIFLPKYKNLPKMMMGCQFGIINISDRHNRPIINMSKGLATPPIEEVPYIMLYLKGQPLALYNFENDEKTIVRFLNSITADLKKKYQQTSTPSSSAQKTLKQQDNTTIGQPIIGFDFKKYLTESECQKLMENKENVRRR
jgi:thiol-disulfide isomerase/thioredoxin